MSVDLAEIQGILEKSECLYSFSDLSRALDEMAHKITEVLAKENPILLTVMNGALITAAELAKRLTFPMEMDYVHATRYRGEFEGGSIHWLHEPQLGLKDRTVLIVDDILDGGITLAEIKAYCERLGARRVYTAVMLDKYQKRIPGGLSKVDFVGIPIEDHFVYGFGLDYKNYWRNLPGIYRVLP